MADCLHPAYTVYVTFHNNCSLTFEIIGLLGLLHGPLIEQLQTCMLSHLLHSMCQMLCNVKKNGTNTKRKIYFLPLLNSTTFKSAYVQKAKGYFHAFPTSCYGCTNFIFACLAERAFWSKLHGNSELDWKSSVSLCALLNLPTSNYY